MVPLSLLPPLLLLLLLLPLHVTPGRNVNLSASAVRACKHLMLFFRILVKATAVACVWVCGRGYYIAVDGKWL